MIAWPHGYRKIRHDELDSTNSEARRLAEAGEARAGLDHRRRARRRAAAAGAGSGTAGTAISPPLCCCVPMRRRPMSAQLSFVAALAAADMAAHFAPHAAITVKWPNDVLADGTKLAGILLEAGRTDRRWLAIGIGVNLASHPEGTEFPATSLAQLGIAPPSSEEALTVLAARFAHWYDAWMDEGFEPLRAAWLARAGGLGAPIRARLPHETRHGVFEGIDAAGALLLNEQGQVRAIAAGEVFF